MQNLLIQICEGREFSQGYLGWKEITLARVDGGLPILPLLEDKFGTDSNHAREARDLCGIEFAESSQGWIECDGGCHIRHCCLQWIVCSVIGSEVYRVIERVVVCCREVQDVAIRDSDALLHTPVKDEFARSTGSRQSRGALPRRGLPIDPGTANAEGFK
jgi:hypothetical protein